MSRRRQPSSRSQRRTGSRRGRRRSGSNRCTIALRARTIGGYRRRSGRAEVVVVAPGDRVGGSIDGSIDNHIFRSQSDPCYTIFAVAVALEAGTSAMVRNPASSATPALFRQLTAKHHKPAHPPFGAAKVRNSKNPSPALPPTMPLVQQSTRVRPPNSGPSHPLSTNNLRPFITHKLSRHFLLRFDTGTLFSEFGTAIIDLSGSNVDKLV